MNNPARTIFHTLTVLGVLMLAAENAHAYIDPGTGTLLIQWIFGAVFAGLAVIRIYWAQAKAYFATRFGKEDVIEPVESEESQEPT